jgi:hypothetical protein
VSLFKGGVRVLTLEKPGSSTDAAARPRGAS